VLLYDNDRPGKIATTKIYRKHPELYACWLPKNTAKDISDYFAKYGKEKTQELISYAKEKIHEEYKRRNRKETKES
jgi:DNA primase